MKVAKGIPLWAFIIGLLLLANLGWMSWNWHYNAGLRSAAKQFKFGYFYTNGVACVGIEEAKTGKPLLIEWDFGDGEKPGEISYFFQGTNVLDVYLTKNKSPRYRFIFRGPEKSEVWWLNMGGGSSFTERVSYDTNGNRSSFEVWYAGTWHPVDRRNEHNGIVIDGLWHQLAFDTNGMATIDSTNNQPSK
jgi:hypothetical protein